MNIFNIYFNNNIFWNTYGIEIVSRNMALIYNVTTENLKREVLTFN